LLEVEATELHWISSLINVRERSS